MTQMTERQRDDYELGKASCNALLIRWMTPQARPRDLLNMLASFNGETYKMAGLVDSLQAVVIKLLQRDNGEA